MGFLIRLLFSLIMAVFIGLGTAWYATELRLEANSLSNGVWTHNTVQGTQTDNIYDRALSARTGFVYLPREDALIFTGQADEGEEPLTGACRYRVTSAALPGSWWSVTAYGPSGQLVETSAGPASVSAGDFAESGFEFVVAATDPGTPWIEVPAGQPFSLVLRIFGPEAALTERTAEIRLPRVVKIDCP